MTGKIFIILFIPFHLIAQVEINDRVIMTGEARQDRQVKGIADPDMPGKAVNAQTIQYSRLKYALSAGTANQIELTLPIPPVSYEAGLHIYFLANHINTGSVFINVNNLGFKPLLKEAIKELDSAEVLPGQLISAIYDGSNFQVLSDLNIPCPSGFIEVAPDYCIEIAERAPATFWNAIKTCGDLGGKLCDWGDWFYACQDNTVGPQLQNMTGNWEWADSGGNNFAGALPINANTVNVVGLNACDSRETSPIQNSNGMVLLNYHCCYKKRP